MFVGWINDLNEQTILSIHESWKNIWFWCLWWCILGDIRLRASQKQSCSPYNQCEKGTERYLLCVRNVACLISTNKILQRDNLSSPWSSFIHHSLNAYVTIAKALPSWSLHFSWWKLSVNNYINNMPSSEKCSEEWSRGRESGGERTRGEGKLQYGNI